MMRGRYEWLAMLGLALSLQPVLSADDADSSGLSVSGLSAEETSRPVYTASPKNFDHPRLLLTGKERESFLSRMQRSERLSAGWRHVQRAARGEVVARQYCPQLSQVAFVAFVNGDEQLATRGVNMLMVAGGLPWGTTDDVATMTEAVATAYDLLYPYMTDQQRTAVRRTLIEKGIEPLISSYLTAAASHSLTHSERPADGRLAAFAGAAGLGALAVLSEEPQAADWVRLACDSLRPWLSSLGCNGHGETISGMAWVSPVWSFLDALYRSTGENMFENMAAGCDSLLDSVAWRTLAWREDGVVKSSLMMLVFGEQAPAFSLFYAALTRHRRDATAAWLADRTAPVPHDIRELVWLDESVAAGEPKVIVPMRILSGAGQVVMRSGWGPDTPAAAISYRRNGGNFGIGSFDLFGGGHPTFVDSGMTTRDRSAIDSQSSESIPSNVVVVDDKPQTRAGGQLLAAVSTSRVSAASVQLVAAYPDTLKSWTRDLVMAPGGLAIVLDRLEGNGKHRFDYVLHPHQPFKTPYPIASPGEILIGADDRPTRAALYSEASFSVARLPSHSQTSPQEYLRFDSPDEVYNRTYLMVCQWPLPGAIKQHAVDVSAVGVGRWQVRRISDDWRLMIRTGTDATENDVDEARLVLVWDQGEKSRERHAILLAARRLGLDNRELISASRPINAAVEFGHPMWAHFVTTQPARVKLAVEPGADYVFLNGWPLEVSRWGNTIAFDLPAGENTLLVSEAAKFIPRQRSVLSDDLLTVTTDTQPSE